MTTYRARASRRTALVLALGTTLLAVGCGSSDSSAGDTSASQPAAAGATVATGLLSFDPETAQIKTGQSVTWVGGDAITHVLVQGSYELGGDGLRTTESDDKAFELKLTKKGQRVSHTYDKVGTYTYYCTIHKGMNGTVVVA